MIRLILFRLLAALPGPRWGLIGPWGHHYPQDGIPGPAIGFLQECDRFLRYALKGEAGAPLPTTPGARRWRAGAIREQDEERATAQYLVAVERLVLLEA